MPMSSHNRSQTPVSHIKYVSLHHALKLRPMRLCFITLSRKPQKEKPSPLGFYSGLTKKLTQNKSGNKHGQYSYFQTDVESLYKMD